MNPEPLPDAFERAVRSLLWRTRTSHLQRRTEAFLQLAQRDSGDRDQLWRYRRVYDRLRRQVIRMLAGTVQEQGRSASRRERQMGQLLETTIPRGKQLPQLAGDSPDFHCDAGAGGMARWLRAAGYDAAFWPGIEDDELIDRTTASCGILLTTDGRLMQRAVIRWGIVPAVLIPLSAGKLGQYRFTAELLSLGRKPPRCMSCGGRLRKVAKQSVQHRVPPRTYPWRDDYFVCCRCDKLFWRGTHWQHVQQALSSSMDAGGEPHR